MEFNPINKLVRSFVGRLLPPAINNAGPTQAVALIPGEVNVRQTPSDQPLNFYALGFDLARKTRALKPDAAMLKALEEQVIALAVDAAPRPFDLDNLTDQRSFARLEALDEELAQAKNDHDIAAAEVRKRSDDLAKCGGARRYPSVHPSFVWIATSAITLSIAPTLHGFFTGLFPLLKWLLAIGFGGTLSLLIVTAILPDDKPQDEEEAQ